MALANLIGELTGTIPNYSYPLAQRHLQAAWQDICNARSWSFKQQTGFLTLPVLVNAGTAHVTQFTNLVTMDATAGAALAPIVNTFPPLVGRQFRISSNGPLYTIADYDSVNRILTLSDLYRDVTNVAAPYQVYQAYYGGPQTLDQDENLVIGPPVHRLVSIEDPNQGYSFTRYHVAKVDLDRIDPTRGSQGQPIWACDWGMSPAGTMLWEFWPHPTGRQTLIVTYDTLYTFLTKPTDTLPDIIPESLVVNRAMIRGAIPWAMANAGRYPALKSINFAVLLKTAKDDYILDMARAKMVDDGRKLASKVPRRGGRRGFPLDADFIQTHDVGRMGW